MSDDVESQLGAPPAVDLAALGVRSAEEVGNEDFARIMLLGPSKFGKTTSLLSTAPKPFVINCDGAGATNYAIKGAGAQFLQYDVTNRATWKKSQDVAAKLVQTGAAQSVIVDTVSLLADDLLAEISITLDGFDRYRELGDVLKAGFRKLMRLPAHLFVVAHLDAEEDTAGGVLPLIAGQTKKWLPAKLADWVLFDVEPGRKPHERMFVLGPQKKWPHSGRNIKSSTMVEATVPALFGALGIPL